MFLYGYGVNGLARVSVSVVVTVVMLLFSASVHADWEIIESGVDESFWDVFFIDELHGWVVGYSGTMLATTDGGKTWNKQACPIDDVDVRKVFFFDTQIGYALCAPGSAGRGSFLLYTDDGGDSWDVVDSDTAFCWIHDMFFIDKDVGWISGQIKGEETNYFGIVHTVDGGVTWEKQYESQDVSFYAKPLAFIDENRGWVLYGSYEGYDAETRIHHTYDGGKTWLAGGEVNGYIGRTEGTLYSVLTGRHARYILEVVPPDTLWVSRYGLNVSHDGGETWNLLESPFDGYLFNDVHPLSGMEAYVLKRTELLYTDDGGETLTLLVDYGDLNQWGKALSGVGRDTVWFVGDLGLIVKYTRSAVAVEHNTIEDPTSFELLQNSPNPFNASTTIEFLLPDDSAVKLSVVNIMGQTVRTLVSSRLPEGSHLAMWDGTDKDGAAVSSGIYLAVLEASGGRAYRRMLLMK